MKTIILNLSVISLIIVVVGFIYYGIKDILEK